jgi:hypothetical protein
VYQGQKVHLFPPSRGFLVEASRDLKTGEHKRHFLAEVHIKFLGDRTNYRSTRTAWRVTQWTEIPPTSGAHLSVIGSGSV